MDLLKLVPTTDTIDVVLMHPATFEPLLNEDGTEITITVYAPHSKEYKAAVHEQTNLRLKQMQKGGRKGNSSITAEELETASIKMLAKTTEGWNVTFDGSKPKFTISAAQDLYERVFWVKDQIEDSISDNEVFT